MIALGLIFTLGFVNYPGKATGLAVEDEGPLIISPHVVDAGEMPAGSVKKLEFVVSNTSENIVRLRYIFAECDCSITLPDSGVVPALGSFVLHAELAAGDFVDQQLIETITILTDNVIQKELKIPVSAWVTETRSEDKGFKSGG